MSRNCIGFFGILSQTLDELRKLLVRGPDRIEITKRGIWLLRNPATNKGLAFSPEEQQTPRHGSGQQRIRVSRHRARNDFVGVREVDASVFLVAARALAEHVDESRLQAGSLLPNQSELRTVSAEIAAAVIHHAGHTGRGRSIADEDIGVLVDGSMRFPEYVPVFCSAGLSTKS